MTREEEINNASYAYWVNNYANIEFIDEEEKELHTQDIQESFIHGALWADRTMIAKACDWLEKKAYLYVWMNCEQGEHGIHKTMLEDFRKAMKGE